MTNIFLENVYLEFPLSYGKSIRTEFIDRFIKKTISFHIIQLLKILV